MVKAKKGSGKKVSVQKRRQMQNNGMQKRAQREKAEAMILNRCLILLCVLAVTESYFLLCYRFYALGTTDHMLALYPVIGVVGCVAFAVLVVSAAAAIWKRKTRVGRIGSWLAVGAGLIAVGSVLMRMIYPLGTTVMCVVTPLLALAGFVYYLYQREFFFSGVGVGLAVAGMWLSQRAAGSSNWGTRFLIFEFILFAAVMALLALAVYIGRHNGQLVRGGLAVPVFSAHTNYFIVYGALSVSAVMLIVGSFLPAAALYLMWAGIAGLFALAVYYTMRMM